MATESIELSTAAPSGVTCNVCGEQDETTSAYTTIPYWRCSDCANELQLEAARKAKADSMTASERAVEAAAVAAFARDLQRLRAMQPVHAAYVGHPRHVSGLRGAA